ncbi:putative PILR alpha-associated neural protein [Scophthalmus maximus]|uniref:Putative PILR alpha-associated neural protein n=1 Tax=Scophthalmus maximus TaxID=52904 RepID=A0A2U9AXG2_SCOMX|nr:putative PILR alpha-associated neural protein [Scophthalmus maximus]
MERCSISPVARLTALVYLLLIALVTPSTCNRDDTEGEEQVDALSVQLSVTAQVTPTPLWAVVWGPTQPLEDETYHFLSSQETDPRHHHGGQQEASTATSEDWPYPDASMQPREETPLESREPEGVEDGGTEAEETEEVDPQFYVTVIISSLLILTAVVIIAKLCSAMVPNHSVLRPAMTNSQTSSLTAIAASHYPRKRPYLCFHNFQ